MTPIASDLYGEKLQMAALMQSSEVYSSEILFSAAVICKIFIILMLEHSVKGICIRSYSISEQQNKYFEPILLFKLIIMLLIETNF